MGRWANGDFQRNNPNEYVLSDSDAVARCQIYDDLCTLQYEDIEQFYLAESEPEPETETEEELPDDGNTEL